MNIAIVGSGNIGGALGLHWAKAGHQVMFSGSRNPQKLDALVQKAGAKGSAGSAAEACQFADVVLLAVPWPEVERVLAELEQTLHGKILIDATNPLTTDFIDLAIGFSDSGGEVIARRLPEAHVVKAFNSVGANIIQAESKMFGGIVPTLFYCGNDVAAKQVVAGLIADSGFDPVDVGPIRSSRFLEPLEQLWVEVIKSGIQEEFIISLLRR
ncbi:MULTISPECIES: NADPH-dependent F420 reductase [Aphanothece]|uniref:NADPH-dependent F420 reductase n=1 Tax=Aphanothece TaxID=1121 RepID=UPI003984C09C